MSRIAVGRVSAAGIDAAEAVVQVNPLTGLPVRPYDSPDGRGVQVMSNMGVLVSDDFGGSAVDLARWDVIDGGLAANPDLGHGGGPLSQGAIGSGVGGITDSVSASALTVAMGTTANAERWYLSRQTVAGSEDLTVILSKSQALGANAVIFIGLVEVDSATGVPLLNPNLAGDFTNRGGVNFGGTGSSTGGFVEAVADSSGAVASLSTTALTAVATSTTFECCMEFRAEDLNVSTTTVDSVSPKSTAQCFRLSSQCPNDGKAYKLLMRFKNSTAPGSNTNVVIQRVLLVDCQEMRVEVTSGRGDVQGAKALAVNLAASFGGALGNVSFRPAGNANTLAHKLIAAATTNATSVKGAAAQLLGGVAFNVSGATKYLKLYNKATAPTVGTDTPVYTIPIPAGTSASIADVVSVYSGTFSTGLAYAITGLAADADTTALAAGDVILNLTYV